MREETARLRGFLPFQVIDSGEGKALAWCDFGDVRLEAPFFIRDIFRRAFLPNPRFVTTPLTALLDAEAELDGLRPDGFIFHMSACGSTLLANMLRAVPRHLSFGEPNVLYDLLALARSRSEDEAVALFRAAVGALGQRRLGVEERYIIKFGSATTLFLPLIGRAFPEVPRLFLYRDPVEVLVSNMRVPTQEWLFESAVTGLSCAAMTEEQTALENCAVALQRTIEAFLDDMNLDGKDDRNNDANKGGKGGGVERASGRHLLANYSQWSPPLVERVLSFFDLQVTPAEMEGMLAVGNGHAHGRQARFEPDTARKQSQASAKLRAVAATYLGDLYERLEALRIQL